MIAVQYSFDSPLWNHCTLETSRSRYSDDFSSPFLELYDFQFNKCHPGKSLQLRFSVEKGFLCQKKRRLFLRRLLWFCFGFHQKKTVSRYCKAYWRYLLSFCLHQELPDRSAFWRLKIWFQSGSFLVFHSNHREMEWLGKSHNVPNDIKIIISWKRDTFLVSSSTSNFHLHHDHWKKRLHLDFITYLAQHQYIGLFSNDITSYWNIYLVHGMGSFFFPRPFRHQSDMLCVESLESSSKLS